MLPQDNFNVHDLGQFYCLFLDHTFSFDFSTLEPSRHMGPSPSLRLTFLLIQDRILNIEWWLIDFYQPIQLKGFFICKTFCFFASSFRQCLCTEPEFRLCWMKFGNSDNHYTNFKIGRISKDNLEVGSATFLQACFVCLKESTCETRESAFYFTSKDLLILEIINF